MSQAPHNSATTARLHSGTAQARSTSCLPAWSILLLINLAVLTTSTTTQAQSCQDVREPYLKAIKVASVEQTKGELLIEKASHEKTIERSQTLRAKARTHFRAAARGYLKAYSLCQRLSSIRYGVALMYEKADDCGKAMEWYDVLIADEGDKEKLAADSKLAGSIAKAKKRREDFAKQCKTPTELQIVCAQSNVQISIDDRPAQPCPVTTNVKPGPHKILANLDGHDPLEQQVEARESATTMFAVSPLSPIENDPPPEDKSDNDPTHPPRRPAPQPRPIPRVEHPLERPLIWSGAAVSGIGAGTLIAAVWIGNRTINRVNARDITQIDAQRNINRANGLLVAGSIVTALGLGSLATGLVLRGLSAEEQRRREGEQRLREIVLLPSPHGANLLLSWVF